MEKASFSPEDVDGDEKRATKVLTDGRQFAEQLRMMMMVSYNSQQADKTDRGLSAKDLVSKILDSFEKSLAILQLPSSCVSDETSQVPANSPVLRSEELDSGQSHNILIKDRRGCFKRRRSSEAQTKMSSSVVEDGHAWRKYGQKSILNSKYPRNYYRCTHKFEQGCQATKQVQKTQEEPVPLYRTTYYGHHTCTTNHTTNHNQFYFEDSVSPKDSSIILSFQPNINSPKYPTLDQDYKDFNSTSTCNFINNKHTNTNKNTTYNQSSSTLADHNYVSHDHRVLTTYGSSSTRTELVSPAGSDHGNVISSGVYSCITSSTTTDQTATFEDELDMMVAGVVDFDDDDLAMDSFLMS